MTGPLNINYGATYGAQNPTGAYLQGAGVPQNNGIQFPGTNVAGMQVPGMTTAGSPLGFNMGTANLLVGGIGTIGNLWASYEAQKLAKQQFQYTKGVTDTNLANQIQSYNTTLSDRINARASMTGANQESVDKYLAENSLRDQRKG